MKTFVIALLVLVTAASVRGEVVDRIAATIERDVITLSEVNQLVLLRVFARRADEDADAYRRRVLDALIAQTLRFRDVERFGSADISPDAIESRLIAVRQRFASDDDFARALAESELTLDELRSVLKRELQVEAYIEERFSPLIFVSIEEIERFYRERWVPQRRARGLEAPPVAQVREEIRDLLKAERLAAEIDKWTEQLRARANVDVFVYR